MVALSPCPLPLLCRLGQESHVHLPAGSALGYGRPVLECPVHVGNRGGGVISHFSNSTLADIDEMLLGHESLPAYITWGTPLLVLQAVHWDAWHDLGLNYSAENLQNLKFVKHGPWLDIMHQEPGANITANISASLCYTAWDVQRLDVNIHSPTSRTEPVAAWSPEAGYSTTPDVFHQLGDSKAAAAQTPSSRGILSLDRKSTWAPKPADARSVTAWPFVQAFADMSSQSSNIGPVMMAGDWTAFLSSSRLDSGYEAHLEGKKLLFADDTLVSLYGNFMSRNASLATSISALITVLSGMAYYDQLPRFRTTTNATQTFFTTVLFPQSKQGFFAVMAMIATHALLVVTIGICFLTRARFFCLGNHWMSVSQLLSPHTNDLISISSMTTDKGVRAALKAVDAKDTGIRVGCLENPGRVGVIRRDFHDAYRQDSSQS